MHSPPTLTALTICLLCSVVPSANIYSQDESSSGSTQVAHDQVHFYVMPMVAIPSPELKKAVNVDAAGGFSAGLLFNPFMKKKPSPVMLGIDFGYILYGVEKIPENGNIPPLKTSFNVYTIGAAARLLGNQTRKFTPFVDGVVGAKIFNTRTKVDLDLAGSILNYTFNNNSSSALDSTNDASLMYAVGLGFFSRKQKDSGGVPRVSFTFRVLYVWGRDTKYVVRNSIAVDMYNHITYQTAYTKTDMIMVQLGIVIY